MYRSTGAICFLLTATMLLSGCEKEESKMEETNCQQEFSGYFQRDENGNEMGVVGTPNVKLQGDNGERFLTYPNPSDKQGIRLDIMGLPENEVAEVKIYASYSNSLGNTVDLGTTAYVPGGEEVLKLTGLTNGNYALDLSSVPGNNAIIILESNNVVLYDNLSFN